MTPHRTSTLVFEIQAPITRADLPGLCDRVCGLLEGTDADVAYCRVTGIEPDAVAVDALARLQLAAHRHASRVRLVDASSELLELVAFMGLRDVLPDNRRLGLEPVGQPELRKQRLGVEEEGELADPPV
jgi:hypothetical protein